MYVYTCTYLHKTWRTASKAASISTDPLRTGVLRYMYTVAWVAGYVTMDTSTSHIVCVYVHPDGICQTTRKDASTSTEPLRTGVLDGQPVYECERFEDSVAFQWPLTSG